MERNSELIWKLVFFRGDVLEFEDVIMFLFFNVAVLQMPRIFYIVYHEFDKHFLVFHSIFI